MFSPFVRSRPQTVGGSIIATRGTIKTRHQRDLLCPVHSYDKSPGAEEPTETCLFVVVITEGVCDKDAMQVIFVQMGFHVRVAYVPQRLLKYNERR